MCGAIFSLPGSGTSTSPAWSQLSKVSALEALATIANSRPILKADRRGTTQSSRTKTQILLRSTIKVEGPGGSVSRFSDELPICYACLQDPKDNQRANYGAKSKGLYLSLSSGHTIVSEAARLEGKALSPEQGKDFREQQTSKRVSRLAST